ncbi:MAG: hypothetical protein Q8O84_01360 [Nanoarchaeota archaeon]|nr:hypothetical protein [Nanoarchaeota archaeon]
MPFEFILSKNLEKCIDKLAKKNKKLAISLQKKIKQIINLDKESINHFKNLKSPLNHLKRVHIESFVLTFQLKEGIIIFEDFVHHDKAY